MPSNVMQLLLVLGFVVPGIVYQTVRARYVGEAPQNREQAAKVLRALAASTLLALVYAIVFAGKVAAIATATSLTAQRYVEKHPGTCALWALLLIFALPAVLGRLAAGWSTASFYVAAGLAWAVGKTPSAKLAKTKSWVKSLQERVTNPSSVRFVQTPATWDWAVRHAVEPQGFVRTQDADGRWWGGAYGSSSYFSDYPQERAIYVEVAWVMSETGEFVEEQASSRGAWIPCKEARVVQFLATQPDTPIDPAASAVSTGALACGDPASGRPTADGTT